MTTFLIVITVLFDVAEALGLTAAVFLMLATARKDELVVSWGKLANAWSIGTLLMLAALNLAVWTR